MSSSPPPGPLPDPPPPVDLLLPPASIVNGTTPPPPSIVNGTTPPPPSGSGSRSTLVALGVGIGIGGALVLVCVGIFVIWYKRRKRMRFGEDGFGYAFPQPQDPKDNPFRGPQPNLQQHTSPAGDVNGQPKPTPSMGISTHSHSSSWDGLSSSNPSKRIPQAATDINLVVTKPTFTYEELVCATENFAADNLLGQGGFGYVYKGVLGDGKEVAIKQMKVGGSQGEREFQAEVETISRVHHKHLVSLFGHCISGSEMLLVYEFVPNRTLDFHLHGTEQSPINWATRMKIALGSARGLRYLHEDCNPKIIHRDIKSANILLDENFDPKVADFGLARFSADTDTHVSTRVMGTFGYLAPEYALTGKLTDKSDVFSFGVVLLELITGRRPIDKSQNYLDDNIIDWARPLLTQAVENNDFDCLADPRIENDYEPVQMARLVACAAACVRHLARHRPRMSQIVLALEGNIPLDDLNEGMRPGHRATHSSHGSMDYDASYDSTQYKEDLIKFRKMALQSVDVTSECSGPSIEFGIQPSGSSSEGQQKPSGSSSEVLQKPQ